VLAESEAGVWRCAHGGHRNRSHSVCDISTPCKSEPLPSRARSVFSWIIDPRSTPDNRPDCDSNHSLSLGPNVRVGTTKSEGTGEQYAKLDKRM
jgi:hypothetical protein